MLVDDAADAVERAGHGRSGIVEIGVGAQNGLRSVVRLEHRVVTEPDPHRLAAAIHRHEVDIDVDQQVRLGGAPVDAYVLAVIGDTEFHHAAGRFAVVIVETIGIILRRKSSNPPPV